MKKIIALGLSLLLAISMCGCEDKDKKDSGKNTSSFKEISPDVVPQYMNSDFTENTFSTLGEMTLTSDCSNIYYANIYCDAPEGVEQGFYSSPEVTVSVDGVAFDVENSAYINVSSNRAIISVSAYVGYVKKDSEITVTVKNFNKLNNPESHDYNDVSDEVVISGSFTLKSKTEKNFGHLRYSLEELGADNIVISEKTVTINNSLSLLGKTPDAKSLVIVLKDNSEVTYDSVSTYNSSDDDEKTEDILNVSFYFEDEDKQIDLGEISDVKINGESIIE
ncbi:MAG: hypothetical protein E7509_02010 [Ruminococcus sp.]|nr:hypothetical protein [Ruminococcus sp.]